MSGLRHVADLLVVSRHAVERDLVPPSLRGADAKGWPRAAEDRTPGALYEAAYGNAVAAHRLDWDDVMVGVPTHPGTVIGAALLAAAGPAGATLQTVACELLAGVDECVRLGDALGEGHYARGWHATATIGRMAAARAVARLLHPETPAAGERALQLAAAQAGGVTDVFGTSGKWLQVGAAAGSAAVSGLIAGHADDITEVLHPTTKLGHLLGMREPLRPIHAGTGVARLRIKRYPCCYHAHPAVLATKRLDPGEDPVRAVVSAPAAGVCHDRPPRTIDEARFSIPWLVAGARRPDRDGALGLLGGAIVDDPGHDRCARRVSMAVDESLPPFAASVEAASETVVVDLGKTGGASDHDLAAKIRLLDDSGDAAVIATLLESGTDVGVTPMADLLRKFAA